MPLADKLTFRGAWTEIPSSGNCMLQLRRSKNQVTARVRNAPGTTIIQSGPAKPMRPDEGLTHNYLVGIAVDPGDPYTIIVSGAASPPKRMATLVHSFIY